MGGQTEERKTHKGAEPALAKSRKFQAPEGGLEKFGVLVDEDHQIAGYVKTEDVRALLDAFGLSERGEIEFPFHHMKRTHGELWSMRIEPAQTRSVAGGVSHVHHWAYQLERLN